MRKDFFIRQPERVFAVLGLVVVMKGFLPADYVCEPDEREVLRMVWEEEHFVVGSGDSEVVWDPWPNSKTVAHGHVVDKRVFKVLGTTDTVLGVKYG
jgi:hypothetical protein